MVLFDVTGDALDRALRRLTVTNGPPAAHTFSGDFCSGASPMKATPIIVLLALAASSAVAAAPSAAPEFTHSGPDDWINSPPLTLAALRGKVVLIEFWAFDCVNCLNSRAWVESLERSRGAGGLVIVSVHTPELSEERSPAAVRKAVVRLGMHEPVMIDGDSSYWNALRAQYWPTFCLIGRDGLLYACVPGEMRTGDQRATKVEQALDLLVKAPTP
jgi:thiol-disulfide isomerase/thioredoxin